MTKLHRIRTVRDFSELMGHRDTHPLVSVIDYASLPPVPLTMNDTASTASSATTRRSCGWAMAAVGMNTGRAH